VSFIQDSFAETSRANSANNALFASLKDAFTMEGEVGGEVGAGEEIWGGREGAATEERK